MKDKLESLPKFPALKEAADVAGLMRAIHDLVFNTGGTVYQPMAIQAQLRHLIDLQQKQDEPLSAYHTRFTQQLAAFEKLWGPFCPSKYMNPPDVDSTASTGDGTEGSESANTAETNENLTPEQWRNRFLSALFLAGVERKKYKPTVDSLHNEFQNGTVSYPQDVPSMVAYLSNRRGAGGGTTQTMEAMQDGVPTGASFHQHSGGGKGKPKNDEQSKLVDLTCTKCSGRGHSADECPSKYKEGTPTSSAPPEAAPPPGKAKSSKGKSSTSGYAWTNLQVSNNRNAGWSA
jgi:hypothetical protein